MKKVVLDTNVLISATFWKGDSFKIVELVDQKKITNYMSKETIAEYSRILRSDEIIEKIKDKDLIASQTVQKVISMSEIVEPKRSISAVEDDPDDDKFIEVAVECEADYIVSQDKHLLQLEGFEGIEILKPEEFLGRYHSEW